MAYLRALASVASCAVLVAASAPVTRNGAPVEIVSVAGSQVIRCITGTALEIVLRVTKGGANTLSGLHQSIVYTFSYTSNGGPMVTIVHGGSSFSIVGDPGKGRVDIMQSFCPLIYADAETPVTATAELVPR